MTTTVRSAEHFEVTGVVQGVGFRPFVHRLASELGLAGFVRNDSTSVIIEVAGTPDVIETFAARLGAEAPPLAHIEQITRTRSVERTGIGFRIADSLTTTGRRTLVSPDTRTCDECRNELFDPTDRRFRHPFITCTNCGPRLTIIQSLPYDRPNTTMSGFPMCDACAAEYHDQKERRHHAQPIACHDCGPTLTFHQDGMRHDDPIRAAAAALARGCILAIKGLGGYHLACLATDDAAVAHLRQRKHRPDKPFALMVADLAQANEFAHVTNAEDAELESAAGPIVLMRARGDSAISPLVAPGNPLVGLMLAYTPVHHLLLAELQAPLVMTSANRSGEPLAFTGESIAQLEDLFDGLLDHDRPIHVPCDDSVVRMMGDRLLPLRRARGFAPIPIRFEHSTASVLAAGGELKNTFCVAGDGHAWVSQHLGDMENLHTLNAFERLVNQYTELYNIEPTIVVADAHPAYLSSKWANERYRGDVVQVQHHHAHVAAVMAEHRLYPATKVIGFAFDGTGYGDDGTIWGGEVLVADAHGYHRAAHLAPIPLPGGDAAIQNPCRVALAHLWSAGLDWDERLASVGALDDHEQQLLRRQLDGNVACVPTTSMGRLFDAVASLVGLRHQITYEAQAAIELELAAERSTERTAGYRFEIDGPSILVAPVLAAIVEDVFAATPPETMAWRFHDAVADIVHRLAIDQRRTHDLNTVVLGGGVFQNALLTELIVDRLSADGFETLTHSLVPPNDGGLALGQAYVAAHMPSKTGPID